ncbi:neuronal acetylcholine receptor subunit alpha-10-like [Diadema setosum]|uniref:neuronal acetylcholine receptor subunit alpha-10-like n=1 Tax=Diadema setosum TaxID=31175 RepID=UPI003B3AB040
MTQKGVESATSDEHATFSHQKELSNYLLDDYGSPTLRPVKNVSQPVQVFFRILIAQVIDFNEKEQQITINGWRRMSWLDHFLKWDKEDYGGIDTLEVSPVSIWLPDVKLLENIDKDFQSEDAVNAIVQSDGMVEWYTPMVISSSCKINVRYFPFDTQTCVLTFGSWAYDTMSLDLNYSDDATQNVFLNNGVWDLRTIMVERELRFFSCCEHPFSYVVVRLVLQRRYEFYVFNMVAPCIMLSAINALVFLVPPESGEKISFSVANLLASILFQQLIGELMPPLGDEIPLLGMFFLFMVLMSCLALGASVMILRLYHRLGDEPVPSWLRHVFLRGGLLPYSIKRARAAFTRQQSKKSSCQNREGTYRRTSNCSVSLVKEGKNDVHLSLTENVPASIHDKSDKNAPCKLYADFDEDFDDETTMMKRELIREEWKTVARKLDKTLGACVAVSTLIVIFVIVLYFVFRG